jgi:serine protease AprX
MKKFVVVFLCLLIAAPAGFAAANNAKLSPDLIAYQAPTARVLIQYNSAPGPLDLSLLQNLVGTVDSIVAQLPLINAIVADLPLANILSLTNQPNVKYITLDRTFAPSLSNAAPAVNAPSAWLSGYTGAGVGIALVDSGVASHPDLNGGLLGLSRVVYSQSFVSGDLSTSDTYGHGTHIAGLIAGDGASSTGSKYSRTFKGIAPSAKLINLRVLDQNGMGTDSAVIAAISEAVTLKPLFNIRVLNLSLGRPVYESYQLDPVCQAAEAAWKSGIVVVVAAGNNGRYQGTNGYATTRRPATILTYSPSGQ